MGCPSQETAGIRGIGYIMLRDFYLKKSRMTQDSWIPSLIQHVPAFYNCISVFWRLCKVCIFLDETIFHLREDDPLQVILVSLIPTFSNFFPSLFFPLIFSTSLHSIGQYIIIEHLIMCLEYPGAWRTQKFICQNRLRHIAITRNPKKVMS